MAKIRFLLPFAFALVLLTDASAQNPPLFHFTEAPGPHQVGLKVVEQYDFSRTYRSEVDDIGKPYLGERARPLQTLVWYPAEKSNAKPMTVGDYADLMSTETNFGKPALSAAPNPRIAGLTPTLATALWAVRDAPLKPGRFPLVVYAPSFSSVSWENADLCEFIASHGYLVIASPDMGATTRYMTMDLAGIDAQARDISFLIGYARTLPNADTSQIAVAGFSWGGISNLFAAARDNRISALVALDGSMRNLPGLVKQASGVHPENMTIPLLFFIAGGMNLEFLARYLNDASMNQGPNVLNAWTHGDLITVNMLGLVHPEFSSRFQRDEEFWRMFPVLQAGDYGRWDGITGYAWVARYTLHFLDAYLKHDAVAMAYLNKTASENGAPPHVMKVDYRAAKGVPASLDTFRVELNRQGFDHAADVYASMQKKNANFKLEEQFINIWGYALMDENHLPEAIGVFKLNVSLHPKSGNVYDSLGEAYMKLGQKKLAIENYKKSLEKDPQNDNAEDKLKELEGSAPQP